MLLNFYTLAIAVLWFIGETSAREEIIADDPYKCEIELFNDANNIRFWLTVNRTGWVGIGVGPYSDNMAGADLFVGGFDAAAEEGSQVYGADYFAFANGRPDLDESQDWILESATEVDGQTTVQLSRPLVTGDSGQDIDITNKTMNVLYAYGGSDILAYHGYTSRGIVQVNLVLEGMPPTETTRKNVDNQ